MGRKDRRALKETKTETKAPAEKKVAEKSPQKITKKVEKVEHTPIKVEKPKFEKIESPVVKTESLVTKTKSDWDKVGIIGNNSVIATFKGLCKMQNKKVGQELHNLMKEWNEKNK